MGEHTSNSATGYTATYRAVPPTLTVPQAAALLRVMGEVNELRRLARRIRLEVYGTATRPTFGLLWEVEDDRA